MSTAAPDPAAPRPSAPVPMLRARGLIRHFRQGTGAPVRAVDGVDLTLEAGEMLGLVGESGCGKSTTGRLLLRLLDPDAGQVLWRGTDLAQLDRKSLRAFRRAAQIVFQDPFASLNPRQTVGGAIEEVLKVHGLAGDRAGRERRVRELLGLVGLDPSHGSRAPHEFSGGQRQRIGIARALAVEPDILILDEPVSALDVSVQAQVVNLLADLRMKLGLTCLFIAHDLSLVRHVCDRVAVMYLGRIVEIGSVGQVFDEPAHPYTRALLEAIPRVDLSGGSRPGRAILGGEVPDPSNPPGGCPFHPRCPHPERDQSCRTTVPALVESPEGTGRRAACIKLETSALDHP